MDIITILIITATLVCKIVVTIIVVVVIISNTFAKIGKGCNYMHTSKPEAWRKFGEDSSCRQLKTRISNKQVK